MNYNLIIANVFVYVFILEVTRAKFCVYLVLLHPLFIYLFCHTCRCSGLLLATHLEVTLDGGVGGHMVLRIEQGLTMCI